MRFVLLLGLVWLGGPAAVESWVAGATLPALRFEDQHGHTHALDGSLRALLFTRDMDAGKLVQAALAENGAQRLADADAVYVSDVSRMPALIRRIIAEPRMRGRGYPMLLDRDGEPTRAMPSRDGAPTLLILDQLRIVRIAYPGSPQELAAALAELAQEVGEP